MFFGSAIAEEDLNEVDETKAGEAVYNKAEQAQLDGECSCHTHAACP